MIKIDWTEECVDHLTRWWAKGKSGKQIAQLFRTELGHDTMTRNAVMGKIWRLGLKRKGSKTEKAKTKAKVGSMANFFGVPRVKRKGAFHDIEVDDYDRSVAGCSFGDFERADYRCRWPVVDGVFCGEKTVPGRPYCQHHGERAYRKQVCAE